MQQQDSKGDALRLEEIVRTSLRSVCDRPSLTVLERQHDRVDEDRETLYRSSGEIKPSDLRLVAPPHSHFQPER
jgi:hypothetical protein